MSEISMSVDTSDYDRKMPEFQRALANLPLNMLRDAADIVEQEMRIEIPKGGTGKLENSVTKSVSATSAQVRTNTGYGKAVDEGRRGFHVEGRPFLRFIMNGKVVYARSANPGPAAPNNFTKRAIQTAGGRVMSALNSRVQSDLGRVK